MANTRRKPLHCRHCRAEFPRTSGAGLFCGDDCRDEYAAQVNQAVFDLTGAGFIPAQGTPNLWVKDGVAVTIEQVKHEGLEQTIRKHGVHVEHIRRMQDVLDSAPAAPGSTPQGSKTLPPA